MPTVKVPPPYQGPTLGRGSVSVEGATVRACIEAVGSQFPGFSEQIFDESGAVHRFVSLFLNGNEINRRDVEKPVAETDEVEILAAIAGG